MHTWPEFWQLLDELVEMWVQLAHVRYQFLHICEEIVIL